MRFFVVCIFFVQFWRALTTHTGFKLGVCDCRILNIIDSILIWVSGGSWSESQPFWIKKNCITSVLPGSGMWWRFPHKSCDFLFLVTRLSALGVGHASGTMNDHWSSPASTISIPISLMTRDHRFDSEIPLPVRPRTRMLSILWYDLRTPLSASARLTSYQCHQSYKCLYYGDDWA